MAASSRWRTTRPAARAPRSRWRPTPCRSRRSSAMFTIFIVDDDARLLKALSRLMRLKGYEVRAFTSPHEFIASHDATIPGCAILDVAMPGLDGLALQRVLTEAGSHRPVIFITGHGNIPTTVRAMQGGA